MFENGSGEALIPAAVPALIAWLISAVPRRPRRPATSSAPTTWSRSANSTPIALPIAGRISGVEQVPGVVEEGDLVGDELDRVHHPGRDQDVSLVSCSGTSPNPARPSSPSISTVP